MHVIRLLWRFTTRRGYKGFGVRDLLRAIQRLLGR
jgi:hypothetical protein